jgi:hypothetical protein
VEDVPDLLAFLPALRQLPAYQDWLQVRGIQTFYLTTRSDYRFEAHYGGRVGTSAGTTEDLIMEVQLYRPDRTLLAQTMIGSPEASNWTTNIYDATGGKVVERVHWKKTKDYPAGFIDRVEHDPDSPQERRWLVNRYGVVYQNGSQQFPEYQDTPHEPPGPINRIPIPSVATALVSTGDLPIYLDALGSVTAQAAAEADGPSHSVPVVFSIPESDIQKVIPKVRAKQRVAVEAYDRFNQNKIGEGYLLGVDNQIDATTGTLGCRGVIETKGDIVLLPNAFLNIHLLLEVKRGVLLMPATAVKQDGLEFFVFVIRSDSTVSKRLVKAPRYEANTVGIEEGVSSGDRVVLDPPGYLKEGSPVRYEPMPPVDVDSGNSADLHRGGDVPKATPGPGAPKPPATP